MFGFGFCEGRFLDYFDGEYFLVLLRYEFIASGESAFPEEITLGIVMNGIILKIVILNVVQVLVG